MLSLFDLCCCYFIINNCYPHLFISTPTYGCLFNRIIRVVFGCFLLFIGQFLLVQLDVLLDSVSEVTVSSGNKSGHVLVDLEGI